MTGPDIAAELARLAGWIDEQLGDETAGRQSIAESAAARIRDITRQLLGAGPAQACAECGVTGQPLTVTRWRGIGETEWREVWRCEDITACNDRLFPELARLVAELECPPGHGPAAMRRFMCEHPLGRPAGSGPFETDRQARELPAVQAIYEAFRASPGAGRMAPHKHRLLDEACTAAGVELGAYDHRILMWLAGWEPEICAVVAGLITRAAAGRGRCGMSAIGRLVIRIEDDSPCPLIGEVIGQEDEDTLIVAWGDDRLNPDGSATGTVEDFDTLVPWRGGGR